MIAAVALAGVVVLAGCGAVSARQKVSIDTVQSSILFGLPSPKPPNAPAPATAQPALTTPAIAPLDIPAESFFQFPVIPPAPAGPCRNAPSTAAPAKPATDEVEGLPAAGTYKWKQSGTLATGGKTYGLGGLQTRYTRKVTAVSESLNPVNGQTNRVFTYQTIEPFKPDGNKLVIDWQVKTNATQQAGTVSEGGIDVISGAVGDPEAGLAIRAINVVDTAGKSVPIFNPATGLVMVLLPLAPKQSWTSQAADPKGATVVLNGTVGTTRLAIDACGDLVAGWPVAASITYTGVNNGQQYKFSQTQAYLFAPQYGGVLVYQQAKGDSILGSSDSAYTLGQLVPDALPAALK